MDLIYDVIRDDLEAILEKLEARERYEEENDFYICKACGMLYTFNQAIDFEFICPSCDQQLEHFDNEILLRALKKRIESIKETLGHA
jgi:transcription initiation factor TFIIE subunit alpha